VFCPDCGKSIIEDQAFCGHCGAKLSDAAGGGRSKTPWEDRAAAGFASGLFRTVREILGRPTAFFRAMPVTGGLADPLLFALIIGMIGIVFLSLWDILLHDSMRDFMTEEMRAAAGRTMMDGLHSPVWAVMTPFLLIFWLFVVSGLLHLFLLIVRGVKNGFEATFRVVSYSVSPFVFLSIPFCGVLITVIWSMMLAIIGLRESHQTTGGKAAFAVLFPLLFFCGMIMVLAALLMGAVMASFGSLMHLYK
jgi:hypothetical protein